MKTILTLSCIILLLSCHTTKGVSGVYTIENNPIEDIQLTLNENKSFVEYVKVAGCKPQWYYGFYYEKGRKILLHQISGDLSYLKKKDTIIYHTTNLVSKREIHVSFNEKKVYDNADIYCEGNRLLGRVNSNGVLIISNDITFDSIIIKTPVFSPVGFKIRDKDFSQLFIVIYNYIFEECSNFGFVNKFTQVRRGLSFDRNWETSNVNSKKPVYLFPGNISKPRHSEN